MRSGTVTSARSQATGENTAAAAAGTTTTTRTRKEDLGMKVIDLIHHLLAEVQANPASQNHEALVVNQQGKLRPVTKTSVFSHEDKSYMAIIGDNPK